MVRRVRNMVVSVLILAAMALTLPAARADDPARLRLGLVKFGTASWEVDTLRRHGLDTAAALTLDTVDLANPAAGEVALQAGGVDAIFTDWLWVARQRRSGQQLVFVPHSSALGDIVVPAQSPIRALADLAGKRLGIAGGPLDKSWLLVRAYSRRVLGHDLADSVDPVFGAPPLLSHELAAGRLDAVLTFWPFAARLSVQGYRSLASMTEIMNGLGFSPPVPMTGFAVTRAWIDAHPGGLERFLAAAARAQRLMAGDAEWQALRPLTAAEDDATLAALRQRYLAGMTAATVDPAQAARLFAVLADTGGAALTGGAAQIPPGLFWTGTAP